MDWFGRMALLLLDMLQKGDIAWSPATPPVHLEKDLKVSSCKPKASEREQSTQGTLQGTDEEPSWGPAAAWATGCAAAGTGALCGCGCGCGRRSEGAPPEDVCAKVCLSCAT